MKKADTDVWLEYAGEKGIHGAILSYLSLKKENFYMVENTVDGKFFVTARGWEDLSEILKSYEELQVEIGEELIGEFLQKEEIARDFAGYYRLYEKYKSDYQIQEILDGNVISGQLKTCCDMGKKASFEERFTVTEMLLEAVTERISVFQKIDEKTEKLYENLKLLKIFLQEKNSVEAMEQFVASRRKALDAKICSELLTAEEAAREEEQIRILEEYFFQLKELHISDVAEGIEQIGERFGNVCRLRNEKLEETKKMLEQAFSFLEECFGEGQELLLFETGLTGDDRCSIFISQYGCPSYFKHCELLLYSKKENELRKECRDLLEE